MKTNLILTVIVVALFGNCAIRKESKMEKTNIKEFKVIGISVKTTNKNEQSAKDIEQLWNRFLSENISAKIPNKEGIEIYSIYTDYEGDYMQPYTAILACKVSNLDEVPEGMIGKTLQGGSYVKSSARGDLAKGLIVNHWSKIWKMDINRAYTADFEVFGEKAQNPSDAEVDFYVAIKE
jgi:predicted transcriptional regulator YdeE